MYDARDLGSFLIMLAVLPLFAVVLAVSLLFVAPFLTVAWLRERWRGRSAGVVR